MVPQVPKGIFRRLFVTSDSENLRVTILRAFPTELNENPGDDVTAHSERKIKLFFNSSIHLDFKSFSLKPMSFRSLVIEIWETVSHS